MMIKLMPRDSTSVSEALHGYKLDIKRCESVIPHVITYQFIYWFTLQTDDSDVIINLIVDSMSSKLFQDWNVMLT